MAGHSRNRYNDGHFGYTSTRTWSVGKSINYAGSRKENYVHVVLHQQLSCYIFDTANTKEITSPTGSWIRIKTQRHLHGAKEIRKSDDVILLGRAYWVDGAQLPEVIPILEQEMRATKLTAITRKHTFKLLADDKLISLRYETLSMIPMQLYSRIAFRRMF